MFWLGLCCGLRLGEMRALRAGQFLADKGAIVVDGYINKMGERTKYNKKGSEERPKFRVAFLTENLSKALAAYIEEKGLAGDDFLFTMDEKPFSQSYAYKNFVAAARRAGLLSDGRKISPPASNTSPVKVWLMPEIVRLPSWYLLKEPVPAITPAPASV